MAAHTSEEGERLQESLARVGAEAARLRREKAEVLRENTSIKQETHREIVQARRAAYVWPAAEQPLRDAAA